MIIGTGGLGVYPAPAPWGRRGRPPFFCMRMTTHTFFYKYRSVTHTNSVRSWGHGVMMGRGRTQTASYITTSQQQQKASPPPPLDAWRVTRHPHVVGWGNNSFNCLANVYHGGSSAPTDTRSIHYYVVARVVNGVDLRSIILMSAGVRIPHDVAVFPDFKRILSRWDT